MIKKRWLLSVVLILTAAAFISGGCGGSSDKEVQSVVAPVYPGGNPDTISDNPSPSPDSPTVGESWSDYANTDWFDDETTEFKIGSAEDLAGLAKIVNAGSSDFYGVTITLSNRINLGGKEWTPIGNGQTAFAGTFDGKGLGISGLTIRSAGSSVYYGLFGVIGITGDIKDVALTGANIEIPAYTGSERSAGSLAGVNLGRITGCEASGKVEMASSAYAGGLVGQNGRTIEDCEVEVDTTVLSRAAAAGGLAGYNQGRIKACWAHGDVKVESSSTYPSIYAGGFVAINEEPGIIEENCVALGSVTATSESGSSEKGENEYAGGFAAANRDGSITECEARGRVISYGSGSVVLGGFLGAFVTEGEAVVYNFSGNRYSKKSTGQSWGIGMDFRLPEPGPSNDDGVSGY